MLSETHTQFSAHTQDKKTILSSLYFIDDVENHRILFSEKLMWNSVYLTGMPVRKYPKSCSSSVTFPGNKILLEVVAVAERTQYCNCLNLHSISVRVGLCYSWVLWKMIVCKLHDKSMRTGNRKFSFKNSCKIAHKNSF